MIYSLSGKLIHTEAELAVVECGGVGYACKTTLSTLQKIAGEEKVTLLTYMSVREDAVELFGFADKEELRAFKLLISVSGVGPKAGLAILSAMNPQQFALAVATSDSKSFTQVKGIGKKTAERICLELKDKVAGETISVRGQTAVPVSVTGGNIGETITALEVLGYSSAEAAGAVSQLDPDLPVEELIKKALIGLARF
ncbi:Holliday junction branch migration protein RuvA [Ruminococcus sp. Marseille-P6503]|uniref:Holliday junction branch migration protein RuvA n=1 Tax=Ruminococcus sp. Marseille-P6503 TaxID=2364796 RepID=UPI000F533D5F|nr:Holliday junction branch migration protein RuvA [Ruminococcus sp. Marseille-P6503]